MNTNGDASRFERGRLIMSSVIGEEANDVLASLNTISPDFGTYMIEAGFADIYGREGLSLVQRELVNLAVLATLGGAEPQLAVHIRGALRVGISRDEIVETFVHLSLYAGHPRTLNALRVAREVFDETPD